jgi:uncharacterized membrane protein
MTLTPQRLGRVAVFAALVYVLSWATAWLPNINLSFFLIFSAGLLWGAAAGAMVGAVGMALWTVFNPYGPAMIPIMLSQVAGAALCGIVGDSFRRLGGMRSRGAARLVALMVTGLLCTVVFYVPVSIVDAWLFQPFWPRLVAGLTWSSVAIISNLVIFPLLFPVTHHLFKREWPDQPS